MKYKVIEVTTRKHWNDFVNLPYIVYSYDENWIAPMESEVKRSLSKRNPYFKNAECKLFNCYNEGKICARVSVVVNKKYQTLTGINTAFFGFFECLPDQEAVRALFSEVEKYCRSLNVDVLEGPFNPHHYSELGLQISCFDSAPSFFQTYNPANYLNVLQSIGFSVSAGLHIMKNNHISRCLKERYAYFLPEGDSEYKIRSFNMKEMKRDLNYMREIFNDAFCDNRYFLPLSGEEYLYSAKYLKFVTRSDLIIFIEHNSTPVGCIHLVLNINPVLKSFRGRFHLLKYFNFIRNKNNIKELIIFAVGIKKSYQRSPAYRYILNKVINLVKDYDSLETTWISESNSSAINAAKKLMLQPDKEFVIMSKSIKR